MGTPLGAGTVRVGAGDNRAVVSVHDKVAASRRELYVKGPIWD